MWCCLEMELWEVTGSRGWGPVMRRAPLDRRPQGSLFSPPATWGPSKRTAAVNPADTRSASSLILGFPAFRTVRNSCLQATQSVVFVTAARADWDSAVDEFPCRGPGGSQFALRLSLNPRGGLTSMTAQTAILLLN